MENSTFCLAHISDLHLAHKPNIAPITKKPFANIFLFLLCLVRGRLPGYYNILITGTYSARAYLSVCEKLDYSLNGNLRHDGLIFTGDICTHGHDVIMGEGSKLFKKMIFDNYNKHYLGFNVAILPGNHDRFYGAFNFPGSYNFEKAVNFNNKWSPLKGFSGSIGGTDRVKRFNFTKPGSEYKLSVICSDFSIHRHKIFSAIPRTWFDGGVAHEEQLDELRRQTENAKSEGFSPIWAFHYPVSTNNDGRHLIGSDQVISLAKSVGVGVILSGHTHEFKIEKYDDISLITVGSALSAEKCSRHFLNLFIDVGHNKYAKFIRHEYVPVGV